MPVVEINIKNDTHKIACNDGEEAKLNRLALKFKEKVDSLNESFPTASEKTLYFMASMMLMDELEENKTISSTSSADSIKNDEETTKMLDMVTEKVESLIHKLEEKCDVSQSS